MAKSVRPPMPMPAKKPGAMPKPGGKAPGKPMPPMPKKKGK